MRRLNLAGLVTEAWTFREAGLGEDHQPLSQFARSPDCRPPARSPSAPSRSTRCWRHSRKPGWSTRTATAGTRSASRCWGSSYGGSMPTRTGERNPAAKRPAAEKPGLDDRRKLTSWAAGCAGRVLAHFETAAPGDGRPRVAVDAARAWGGGTSGLARLRMASSGPGRPRRRPPGRASRRGGRRPRGRTRRGHRPHARTRPVGRRLRGQIRHGGRRRTRRPGRTGTPGGHASRVPPRVRPSGMTDPGAIRIPRGAEHIGPQVVNVG